MNIKKEYDLFPVFYSSCRIIDGSKYSALCDLQRGNLVQFPKLYSEIFLKFKDNRLKNILAQFSDNSIELIEIIDMLKLNEYIFFTKYPARFPPLSMDWFHYCEISNLIVDYVNDFNILKKIKKQIFAIRCENIKIRIFNSIDINELNRIIDCFSVDSKLFFEIFLPVFPDLTHEKIAELVNFPDNLSGIVFFSSNSPNKIIMDEIDGRSIRFITDKLVQMSCGLINPDFFCNNISHFTEAHHHNTCLNRKISIDADGNIRNCPSMPQSFGNIRDTTLEEALNHPDFKKYWNHKKDDIEVCRDCEFRYICTDCRAYLEDPHNEYSKPLKCGYDPYTGEWSEWSTNPLKQAAIQYYGMEDLVKRLVAE